MAKNSHEKLQAGMALGVQRIPYKHYGIYAGEAGGMQFVIHYADGCDATKGAVTLTSLNDFQKDDHIWVENFEGLEYTDEICSESLRRAVSRLGEQNYNLLSNNCEHFVSWCVTGKCGSQQIKGLISGMIENPNQVIQEKIAEFTVHALRKIVKKHPVFSAVVLGTIILSSTTEQKKLTY